MRERHGHQKKRDGRGDERHEVHTSSSKNTAYETVARYTEAHAYVWLQQCVSFPIRMRQSVNELLYNSNKFRKFNMPNLNQLELI